MKTKFKRLTAFILALTFIVCGTISVSAGAGESSSEKSTTDTSLDDIKELLNSISYEEYLDRYSSVKKGSATAEFDAFENYFYTDSNGRVYTPVKTGEKYGSAETVADKDGYYVTLSDENGKLLEEEFVAEDVVLGDNNLASVREYEGIKALYTPGDGSVSWKIDMSKYGATDIGKYSILLECYTVQGKSADIERMFRIDGKVPFSEARYITISKIWKNTYPDGSFELGKKDNADDYLNKAKELGIKAELVEKEDGKNTKQYIKFSMPDYWTSERVDLIDSTGARFFLADIDANEIRQSMTQNPEWTVYELRDSEGYYSESFEFVLDAAESTITLESVNECLAISKIKIYPREDTISYKDYLKKFEGKSIGTDKIKIEGEYFDASSSQTLYPVEDRTSPATSPCSPAKTLLNTVGGEKWETAGQWVRYDFKVNNAGLYNIVMRFRQNVLDGMYTSRMLQIYTEYSYDEYVAKFGNDDGYYNGIPFAEAARCRFNYDSDWCMAPLNDGEAEAFDIYFNKDVKYTIYFQVALGNMGNVVNTIENALTSINNDYLNILKLTGSSPDEYRDYSFSSVMPDTIIDLIIQSRVIYNMVDELENITNSKSSMTATLEKIARLLEEMGTDEDNIAKNLEQLKTYIGTLGTWIGDAKTQPLQLDYFIIQGSDQKVPKANANFFVNFGHEILSFYYSFVRNYNRMGSLVEASEDTVEVWHAYGRDQNLVIRNLINDDFTPNSGIAVDLKLVAGGTLLPSILAGTGPDVYVGLGQADVINYAIRGALISIEDMDGYDEAITDFNDAAMIVMGIEDSTGEYHCYGLPETQNFPMMFVRDDILANLNIDIPKTWDDILAAISKLQSNNMQIGLHADYQIFLYQMGGELFADGGMRINLDSNVALEAFNMMCNMFTMYSFPYKYEAANRFRTGEMPIIISSAYTGTYNQLKVFATEIEGQWSFYPLPGIVDDEGNINNVSVSACSAIVMIAGCDKKEDAWEFMKWHVGPSCQEKYSNEMVALIGPSAKHSSANRTALENMPWTRSEYEQLSKQFNSLASIPNYPGYYIIGRYTRFAFLDAYNNSADPVTELLSYITTINKEITRKREEFELETLELGQTLAEKRIGQASEKFEDIASENNNGTKYADVIEEVNILFERGTLEAVNHAIAILKKANETLFADVIKYLADAATALESY